MKHYLWVFVLSGIWLVIAPFFFDYITTTLALWNDIIVGVFLVVVAIFAYSQESD